MTSPVPDDDGHDVINNFEFSGIYNNTVHLSDSLMTGVNEYLGMENGDIPDANIQASHHVRYLLRARLGDTRSYPWDVSGDISRPWIQADIGYQTCVTGVVTQGDGSADDDWVTSFSVSTFLSDSSSVMFVTEQGRLKVRL